MELEVNKASRYTTLTMHSITIIASPGNVYFITCSILAGSYPRYQQQKLT